MTPETNTTSDDMSVSPLCADDLDAVISIDKSLGGVSRRGFFEKRLAAALERPQDFVYVGLHREGMLVGFAMARLLEGEFGKSRTSAALDALGVAPDHQGKSAGHKLLAAVEEVLRHKGVSELTSQVDWQDHGLISFFADAGFDLAPRTVLTRNTSQPLS